MPAVVSLALASGASDGRSPVNATMRAVSLSGDGASFVGPEGPDGTPIPRGSRSPWVGFTAMLVAGPDRGTILSDFVLHVVGDPRRAVARLGPGATLLVAPVSDHADGGGGLEDHPHRTGPVRDAGTLSAADPIAFAGVVITDNDPDGAAIPGVKFAVQLVHDGDDGGRTGDVLLGLTYTTGPAP